jgi:sugar O-acyltransferase (sialic acid O-acetyltransferase NeuD family)
LFRELTKLRNDMRVILLGGGGHASDVLGALEALNAFTVPSHRVEIAGILADEEIAPGRFLRRQVRQIGNIDDLKHIDATHYIACVGYPKGRKSVVDRADAHALAPFTVIHPRAWLSSDVVIGAGAVILANACISANVSIGAHACISNGAIIGHDCRIADFVSVMPGACISGNASVSEGCMIGANATVLEGLSVGAWATVGAGAVVTSHIPEHVVAKGMPARHV